VAVLRAGWLELLTSAGPDEEILGLARQAGPWGTVAANAPLTRPLGRCCLDDDYRSGSQFADRIPPVLTPQRC
jgi:hypothetical protein